MNAMLRWVLMACALAVLTACGFKLRSEMVLPPELTIIRVQVADQFSPLQRNLEQALARSGARAPAGNERSAVLRISRNRISRWPLSVGRTGRVQEYSMRYEVTMQLVDAGGAPVVPRQDIQLERTYQFETIRAQGTPGEEEVVRAELERDMAQAILRRVDAVLSGR
ncbi:LPS assembly lipoprotein LptE [Xanthomonadaceae bacterium JHOS43]|jgi:LPS-assembly lipoprotein|nr:LPS assembly lipoprotein LptE [Xanthomonadaceae bacterium JHOS43]MCX7562600.1 LPS assembly lipoprotein LptE [Xanthomonadaceae bacterium XH05]